MHRHKVYIIVTPEQAYAFGVDRKKNFGKLFTGDERLTAYGKLENAEEAGRKANGAGGLISGRTKVFYILRLSYCSELQRALSGLVVEKRTAKNEPYITPGPTDTRLISREGMEEIVNHTATFEWCKPYEVQA